VTRMHLHPGKSWSSLNTLALFAHRRSTVLSC